MHLARCELVQCVVTLVALLDCPGLHIVRGASQPTSVLWPLAPCVDAAEIGGRGHLDCHEELLGGDAQELNACGFLLCLPCKLYPPRVPQWYVPCKKACVFTLRVGGGWPCRGPCFNVKNHRGDHVCRYHWGVLPENRPADSPIDTRHPSR